MYKTPDQLKKEFYNRAKWYCKGFGDRLSGGIKIQLNDRINHPEFFDEKGIQENLSIIRDSLQFIVEAYETIPFDELQEQNHHDYDLL